MAGNGARAPHASRRPGCAARWPPGTQAHQHRPCASGQPPFLPGFLCPLCSASGAPKGVDALLPLLFTILDEGASPLLPDSMKVRARGGAAGWCWADGQACHSLGGKRAAVHTPGCGIAPCTAQAQAPVAAAHACSCLDWCTPRLPPAPGCLQAAGLGAAATFSPTWGESNLKHVINGAPARQPWQRCAAFVCCAAWRLSWRSAAVCFIGHSGEP